MSDQDDADELLAIDIGPETYASTAATDTPTPENPRTHQTEAAYQQIKTSYTALQHPGNGTLYVDLMRAVPALSASQETGDAKIRLSKRDQQLLGYVIGELYWDRKFERIVQLCDRVTEICCVDKKLGVSLGRWKERAREKVGG